MTGIESAGAELQRLRAAPLVPLPAQPDDVPWPVEEWSSGDLPAATAARVDALVAELLERRERYGDTYAFLLVHRGRLVREHYLGALAHRDGVNEPVTATSRLRSWSIAKSVLHAAVGVLVGEGRLVLDDPAPVPEWVRADPRRTITLEHLLTMCDGLAWNEAYTADAPSDVYEMLFRSGRDDVAAYATSRRLAYPPGTRFNYSSGTSNIVSAVVRRAVEPVEPYEVFLRRFLDHVGLHSAQPRFDPAGTFVGSSYVFATARDFARFGLLYLRDGAWSTSRVLPPGWVDHGRRVRSHDPADHRFYGAHWWATGDDHGTFWASGYAGQSVLVCPALDVVAVRLGSSEESQSAALLRWRASLVAALVS